MFASGLGPVTVAVFSVATMLIAIPTGVKIVNWTLTLWGGKLWYTTSMMFAIGVIVLFTIGGLSGVTHAVAPSDTQQTDTYYIVAHFHYVIVGGAVMGLFAGFYYWWPKVFNRLLNERLGRWNFWLMFFGVNLTFGPMHILGLQGQPRRMVVWPSKLTGQGFFNLAFWNKVSTVGSFVLALGVLVFVINIVYVWKKAVPAPLDPWDARTLEWMTASPPKEHNFDAVPTVHSLDEFFHRKYEEVDGEHGPKLVKVKSAEEIMAEQVANADTHIHLPSPSYWPIILAFAFPIIAYGVIFNRVLCVVGAAVLLLAIFGWALEPSVADDSDYDPPADGGESTKELASIV
jgi:cytochrome c oxidase subunit 1